MLTLGNIILTLGLVLSASSQLRTFTPVIGPAELLLLSWLIFTISQETGRLGPPLTWALGCLLLFWSVFALSLGLGLLVGLVTETIRDPESVLHDTISYVLLALVSGLLVAEPGAASRLRQLSWLYATIGTGFMAVLLVNAFGYVHLPGIEPWFWERLQGWSENPNQLALECASLLLLSLYLAETAATVAGRIGALACAILPIVVGRLTGSDTFGIVMLMAGPIFLALKWRIWLAPSPGPMSFRFAFGWVVVFSLPLAFASALAFAPALAEQSLASHMKGGGKEVAGESQLRLALWEEAFTRGVESGMIGLGPGAHLVSTAYKRVPPPNFEAHNTVLDLFTQGGLLAILSFGGILATALLRTLRVKLAGLTTLLIGLALFSTFHLVVRHPIFWFSVALCLAAKPQTVAEPALIPGT